MTLISSCVNLLHHFHLPPSILSLINSNIMERRAKTKYKPIHLAREDTSNLNIDINHDINRRIAEATVGATPLVRGVWSAIEVGYAIEEASHTRRADERQRHRCQNQRHNRHYFSR